MSLWGDPVKAEIRNREKACENGKRVMDESASMG
jgi:hypothetical protein